MTTSNGRIHIRLLGEFAIGAEDSTILDDSWPRRKALALVKLLAVQPERALPRDAVLDALWPSLDAAAASANLRTNRYHLRKALSEAGIGDVVEVARHRLALAPDVSLDVEEFRATAGVAIAGRTGAPMYETALSLYDGDLLPEDRHEDWTAGVRDELRNLYHRLLTEASQLAEAQGDPARAASFLERLTRSDPLNEAAHRSLMLSYARAGRRSEALRHYDQCEALLRRELDVEPDSETQALRAAIKEYGIRPAGEGGQIAGPFVGRDRELEELRNAFEEAWSGRGNVALIAGEAGMGKTRLAEELATYARLRGGHVAWGRSYQDETTPAFWPWVQAIRTCEGVRKKAAAQDPAGGLASVLEVPDSQAETHSFGGDGREAQFNLFSAVSDYMRQTAHAAPLVLVLDDLHWADEDSLALFHFLAREIRDDRFLLVGTYRQEEVTSDHPLSTILSGLTRERHCRRIALHGLDTKNISVLLGTSAPGALASDLHARTAGNPLFVTEIIRLMQREQFETDGAADGWTRSLPDVVRDVLRRRLAMLPAESQQVLRAAAVIGKEFEVGILSRITELPAGKCVEALDEALNSQIISTPADSPARFVFAHPLIRETLFKDLPPSQRAQLHARTAEVLEDLHGSDNEAVSAELAHHYHNSAALGNADRAVRCAKIAGDHASRLLAYGEAVRLYQLGLDSLQGALSEDREVRNELRLSLSRAKNWAGQRNAAKSLFREIARDPDVSPAQFAQAAYGFSTTAFSSSTPDEESVALLERALERPGVKNPKMRVLLLGALSARLEQSLDQRRRGGFAREAVALARKLGDEELLSRALGWWHDSISEPSMLSERQAASDEAAILATRQNSGEALFPAKLRQALAYLESGDSTALSVHIPALMALAEQTRVLRHRHWATLILATRTTLVGDFEAAEALSNRALALGQETNDPDVLSAYGSQLFAIRWHQGRLDEIADMADQIMSSTPDYAPWRAGVGVMKAELGNSAGAAEELDHLAADGFVHILRDRVWLVTIALIAQLCVLLQDAKRAATIHAMLLPSDPYVGVGGFGGQACVGANARVIALLEVLLGRPSEAAEHFEQALEVNTRIGALPWIAHTEADYAMFLRDRDEPGDADRARALLSEAANTARELGMARLEADIGMTRA